jgi:hypothetical protein
MDLVVPEIRIISDAILSIQLLVVQSQGCVDCPMSIWTRFMRKGTFLVLKIWKMYEDVGY